MFTRSASPSPCPPSPSSFPQTRKTLQQQPHQVQASQNVAHQPKAVLKDMERTDEGARGQPSSRLSEQAPMRAAAKDLDEQRPSTSTPRLELTTQEKISRPHAVIKTLNQFREATAAALEKRRLLGLEPSTPNPESNEGTTDPRRAASGPPVVISRTQQQNNGNGYNVSSAARQETPAARMHTPSRVTASCPSSAESGEILEVDPPSRTRPGLSGRSNSGNDRGIADHQPDGPSSGHRVGVHSSSATLHYPLPPRPPLLQNSNNTGAPRETNQNPPAASPPGSLGPSPTPRRPQSRAGPALPADGQKKHSIGGGEKTPSSLPNRQVEVPSNRHGDGKARSSNPTPHNSAQSRAASCVPLKAQGGGPSLQPRGRGATESAVNITNQKRQGKSSQVDNGASTWRVTDYKLYIISQSGPKGFRLSLSSPTNNTPTPRIWFLPRTLSRYWPLGAVAPSENPPSRVIIYKEDVPLAISHLNLHALLQVFFYL